MSDLSVQNNVSATQLVSTLTSSAVDQVGDSFATTLAGVQGQVSDQAIANFYDLYQQSQITGVPTSKFNKALADIGFKPDQVSSAVELMQSRGHTTDAPTIGAILKYGSEPSAVGNQTYMKQGAVSPTVASFVATASAISGASSGVKSTPVSYQADMTSLNEKTGGLVGNATNYFEAAMNLTKNLEVTQISDLTIDQVANQIAQRNQAAMMQTQDYLAMRQLMAG